MSAASWIAIFGICAAITLMFGGCAWLDHKQRQEVLARVRKPRREEYDRLRVFRGGKEL